MFSLVVIFLSYFYWYRNDFSDDDKLVALLDLALRTLGWGAICVYLHTQLFNLGKKQFPLLLKAWWVIYITISCYSLVIDIIFYKKHVPLPIQYLIYDIVSVITGLFFCYMGFLRKNDGGELKDTLLLQEPLLNSDSSSSNHVESSVKSKMSECVTPYSNAGLCSILSFSWMGSLIALGNKRTLDLEDVPRLDCSDSIYGVSPVLQNKLEAVVGVGNGLTALRLAKVLFFSAWQEILFIAILVLLYTLATYVGPYLIDNFVQYLNGRQAFEYEGYVLVSGFFVAQLFKCLSERHWFFQVQQVGIRFRAALVAMIYNKGLTLSCQAKQGNTSGESLT